MPQRSLYLCGFLFVLLLFDTGQARIWRWLPQSACQSEFSKNSDWRKQYGVQQSQRRKEAEEKQLRSLGVSEKDIEKLRVHDWAIFNSDRRYYQRMQETGTYLEEVAADMTQPEIKTVEDFLDNIENQQLYQVLIKVDRLTLQAILLQIQGYSIAEIAAILGMKEDTVYKRLGRLKQKIKKLLG